MKKGFIVFCLLILTLPVFSESLKGGVSKKEYEDFFEKINLSTEQKQQIMKIRNEENFVVNPLVLDYEAKENGVEFLKSLKCGMFDTKCKIKLRDDIEEREREKKEALRKIWQKKSYYSVRYRNVLTREQDLMVQKFIEENIHKEKVIKERMERAERQAKIDKLKFWNFFIEKYCEYFKL